MHTWDTSHQSRSFTLKHMQGAERSRARARERERERIKFGQTSAWTAISADILNFYLQEQNGEAENDPNAPGHGFSSIEGYTTPGPLKTSAPRVSSPLAASSPTGTTIKGAASRAKATRASIGKGTSLCTLPPVHENRALDTVPEGSHAGKVDSEPCELPHQEADLGKSSSPSSNRGEAGPSRPSILGSFCKSVLGSMSASAQRWDAPSPTSTPLKKLGSKYAHLDNTANSADLAACCKPLSSQGKGCRTWSWRTRPKQSV
jgi:hypothetical protein